MSSSTPKKASKSPLSQSHSHSSDDSDSDSEQQGLTIPITKLAALSLVEEVEIDINGLHPNSPEVICKQATINVGK